MRAAARGRDLGGQRGQRIGAPRRDGHARAVPREEPREMAAEAARRAGHERDAAGEHVAA